MPRVEIYTTPWCPYCVAAKRLLERLEIEPVLDLNLRLGEGSGAALTVPILRSACAVMREMATFSGAGVTAAGH